MKALMEVGSYQDTNIKLKDENIRTLESKIEKIVFKSCYDVYKKVIKKIF